MDTVNIALNNWALISQIITAVFSTVTAIVAITALVFSSKAFNLSFKEFTHNKKKCHLEETVEIAKQYANLIDRISYVIMIVGDNPEIYELIDRVKLTEMEEFNQKELLKHYKAEDLEKLSAFFLGEVPLKVLIAGSMFLNGNVLGYRIGELPLDEKKDEIQLYLSREFKTAITSVMNSFEHLSIALTTQIADEVTLYQPLHKSFLAMTKILYFNICISNASTSDKLFVNTIALFKIWRDRDNQNKQRERQIQEEAKKARSDAEEKIRREMSCIIPPTQTLPQ